MKILFICNEYPPSAHGGIGSFVYTLGHNLSAHGFEVHVVGYDEIPRTFSGIENGVYVTRIVSPFRDKKKFFKGKYNFIYSIIERIKLSEFVKRYCQVHQIEVVENYDWSGPLWFHPGIPLVVRMHGAHTAYAFYEHRPISRFLSFTEKKNLLMADRLVGVSKFISNLTLEVFGLQNRNYQVIYNGIDTTIFHPLEITREEREILFAGTVARRKGIYEFFAALPKVYENFPDLTVKVVGRLPYQDQKKEELLLSLRSLVPEKHYKDIQFTDARPYSEMPLWYNRATCAVFPSLAEAFGFTCVEAMACGAPVIMTSRASGPELVKHLETGMLVEPTDKNEFSNAMIELLRDRQLRQTLGSRAVEEVQNRFDWKKILNQNIDLYNGALSQG